MSEKRTPIERYRAYSGQAERKVVDTEELENLEAYTSELENKLKIAVDALETSAQVAYDIEEALGTSQLGEDFKERLESDIRVKALKEIKE